VRRSIEGMSMAERAGDAELLAAIPTDEAAFEAFYGRHFAARR